MTKPHVIPDADENGNILDRPLALVHPASPASVIAVLSAVTGDPDGRSEYCWVRLANGDLILGVFPCGDTYFSVEKDAQYPGPL